MKDQYVYPGTDVLKNKLNIKDNDKLGFVEKDITTPRLKQIKDGIIKGNFDINHFKSIHKHIFGDIYSWAGEFRNINLFKEEAALGGLSVDYSNYKNIEKDINTVLKKLNSINWTKLPLDSKAHEFTKLMADVWKAHGYREGNTRTTVTFFSEFAKANGFPLKEEILSNNAAYVRRSLVAASFEVKGEIERNYSYLERIIKDSIQQGAVIYSNIKEKYIKEMPIMKNASEGLLNKLHELKQQSPDEEYLSIKEIKKQYKELGKKVENGLLNENNSTFKLISDINNELKILQSRNKDISNEKIKSISMECEL